MGYWKDEIGHWNLLLFDDGTCVANDAYDGNSKVDGKWTFDTETKYLVNSATKSTFLLTLYDEENLMGVNIKNNSTVSYKKMKNGSDVYLIMSGSWKSRNGDLFKLQYNGNEISGTKVPPLPSNTNKVRYKNICISFSFSGKEQSYTYQIKWYADVYAGYPDNKYYPNHLDSYYTGTLTIENPYSPSKCKAIFTGVLEGVYEKVPQ